MNKKFISSNQVLIMCKNYSISRDGEFEFISNLYKNRYCNNIDCKCKSKKFNSKSDLNRDNEVDHHVIVSTINVSEKNCSNSLEELVKERVCMKHSKKRKISSFERFKSLFS
jgi:hypothetical protein